MLSALSPDVDGVGETRVVFSKWSADDVPPAHPGQTFAIKELPEPDKDDKTSPAASPTTSTNPPAASSNRGDENKDTSSSGDQDPAPTRSQLPECGSWVMVEGVADGGSAKVEPSSPKPAADTPKTTQEPTLHETSPSGSPKGARSAPKLSPSSNSPKSIPPKLSPSSSAKSTPTKASPSSGSPGSKRSAVSKSSPSSSPRASPPRRASPKGAKVTPSKSAAPAGGSPKEARSSPSQAKTPASVNPMPRQTAAVQQAWETAGNVDKSKQTGAAVGRGESSKVKGQVEAEDLVVEDIEVNAEEEGASEENVEVFSTPSAAVKQVRLHTIIELYCSHNRHSYLV